MTDFSSRFYNWFSMRLEYWYNGEELSGRMERIKERLERLEEEGWNVEYVRADKTFEADRRELYVGKISTWASETGNKVRKLLRHDRERDRYDYDFGLKRPMLLVYHGDELKEVFPRQEPVDTAVGIYSGEVFSEKLVEEYLEELLER